MSKPENKPYITVTNINGACRVNMLVYDSKDDSYIVVVSREKKSKAQAVLHAIEWAKRDGLEYRP